MGVAYHFPCCFLEKYITYKSLYICKLSYYVCTSAWCNYPNFLFYGVSHQSVYNYCQWHHLITHNHFIGIPLSFHLSLSLKVCCNSATLSLSIFYLSISIKNPHISFKSQLPITSLICCHGYVLLYLYLLVFSHQLMFCMRCVYNLLLHFLSMLMPDIQVHIGPVSLNVSMLQLLLL